MTEKVNSTGAVSQSVSGFRERYQLYIGGSFRDGAADRTFPAVGTSNETMPQIPSATEKDANDAVTAARTAYVAWSQCSGHERGRALYRVAEALHGHRARLADAISRYEDQDYGTVMDDIEDSIDLWIWWTGWADKNMNTTGSCTSLSSSYLNFTTRNPLGVIAVLAPQESSSSCLINTLLPAVLPGNTVILIPPERHPIFSLLLAEALMVSDFPAGAINILTGDPTELDLWLAAHEEVDGIDLTGATQTVNGSPLWHSLERAASSNLGRIMRPELVDDGSERGPSSAEPNQSRSHDKDPRRIAVFTKQKSIRSSCGR